MERYVKSKKELKAAVNDKVDVIIVDKDLYNDLKPIIKLKKLPKKKIIATVGFISTTGAVIIGSVAATPVTGGVSGAAALIGTMPAVATFSATAGVPTIILVGVLLLCISLSIAVIVELINGYDYIENELEVKNMFRFKRRVQKNKD